MTPFYLVYSCELLYIVTIFMIINKFITILMFQHGAWKLHALSSYGLDMPLVGYKSMQVQVPTKACSSSPFLLQCRHNLTTTLPQPCSNLATTLQQGCNSFNSMVFATLWQPGYGGQPCYRVAARLQQACNFSMGCTIDMSNICLCTVHLAQ